MHTTCRTCGAAITMHRTTKGRWMPVDPDPIPGGNLNIIDGVVHVVQPEPRLRRHVAHFTTCPNANDWRIR